MHNAIVKYKCNIEKQILSMKCPALVLVLLPDNGDSKNLILFLAIVVHGKKNL